MKYHEIRMRPARMCVDDENFRVALFEPLVESQREQQITQLALTVGLLAINERVDVAQRNVAGRQPAEPVHNRRHVDDACTRRRFQQWQEQQRQQKVTQMIRLRRTG